MMAGQCETGMLPERLHSLTRLACGCASLRASEALPPNAEIISEMVCIDGYLHQFHWSVNSFPVDEPTDMLYLFPMPALGWYWDNNIMTRLDDVIRNDVRVIVFTAARGCEATEEEGDASRTVAGVANDIWGGQFGDREVVEIIALNLTTLEAVRWTEEVRAMLSQKYQTNSDGTDYNWVADFCGIDTEEFRVDWLAEEDSEREHRLSLARAL
jgi:hypothetical protein